MLARYRGMAEKMTPESSDREPSSSREQSIDQLPYSTNSSSDLDTSSENPRNLSILDVLKSPAPSDLARKRRVGSNKPPVGKKRSRGRVLSSPKSVLPMDPVKTYPGEVK